MTTHDSTQGADGVAGSGDSAVRVEVRPVSRCGVRRRCIGMFLAQDRPSRPGSTEPDSHVRTVAYGTAVLLRELKPGDRDLLRVILENLGWESRTQRFLAPRPILSRHDVSAVTAVDGLHHAGVIALANSSPIGAAHYVRTADPEVAEVALEVVDDWQGGGVGGLLVAETRRCAKAAGFRRLEWFTFQSNRAVSALARDLQDIRYIRVGGGVVRCSAALH
jgi:GNAT superfamily N-acetyltransferase